MLQIQEHERLVKNGVSVEYPETSTTFIDRFLASAEAYRVPVKILFNKVDEVSG